MIIRQLLICLLGLTMVSGNSFANSTQADTYQPSSASASMNTVDSTPSKKQVMVVPELDLKKYAGKWFEVSRFPNPFQKESHINTSATYVLREDGMIDVINAYETLDGKSGGVQGLAKIIDPAEPAKLGVSFFEIFGFRPVWGDYWVLYIDEAYTLAIVGDRDAKYGWALSRTQTISADTKNVIETIFSNNGYDTSALIYAKQPSTKN